MFVKIWFFMVSPALQRLPHLGLEGLAAGQSETVLRVDRQFEAVDDRHAQRRHAHGISGAMLSA